MGKAGLTVPGRPYVGRFYAGPAGTLVPTCASGRADRPRSAAGMGSGFSMRSMMVPDPVFRPRTSRDAGPYLET